MTQMELADKLGISFQAVSNWERGNTMPDISKLPELARIFQVSVDELLNGKASLVEAVLDGTVDNYIEEGTITEQEIIDTLPLLKPEQAEKIVIRILDYTMSAQGLEALGFNQSNYEKVLKMIAAPSGIILVTGATGSGKSTTVYSILQRLNKEDVNIITVEDPVEMNIEGINQIQTNSEIGLTFATALRSILRQDPNIIMIGEIRDTETAQIAVRASITGHLVLSTIHTNNSLNTIERLLDMDVERYLLASALTGIISQKLARRLCPHCKTKRKTNEYEKELFQKVLHRNIDEIYTTEGCAECGNGYSGRIAIHEVLLVNQAIKDAISSNMPKEKLRHLVYTSDVITLLEDGLEKVAEGYTTFEELLKIIELDDVTENKTKKDNLYDLKEALDYTSIAQHPNDEESPREIPTIVMNESNKNETKEKKQDKETTKNTKGKDKEDNIIEEEKDLDSFLKEQTSTNSSFLDKTNTDSFEYDDDDDLMRMEF